MWELGYFYFCIHLQKGQDLEDIYFPSLWNFTCAGNMGSGSTPLKMMSRREKVCLGKIPWNASRIQRQLVEHTQYALHSEGHLEKTEAFSMGSAIDWSPSGDIRNPHLAEMLPRHHHKVNSCQKGLPIEDMFPMASVKTAAINFHWWTKGLSQRLPWPAHQATNILIYWCLSGTVSVSRYLTDVATYFISTSKLWPYH